MEKIINLLKKEHLEPLEKLYLQDRIVFLKAVWEDIIIKHSSEKINDLKDNQIKALNEVSIQFNIVINRNNFVSDLDHNIVCSLLKLAVKLNNEQIIDSIYKRTKNAIPKYYYWLDIFNSYINIDKEEKGKKIVNDLIKSNKKPYLYQIIYNNISIYDNHKEIQEFFKEKQIECISKILQSGESMQLNVDLEFLKSISKYI